MKNINSYLRTLEDMRRGRPTIDHNTADASDYLRYDDDLNIHLEEVADMVDEMLRHMTYDPEPDPKPRRRWAVVTGRATLEQVQSLLPSNYEAHLEVATDKVDIFIVGRDQDGWTLDGYVIPRLGSALIPAREVFTYLDEESEVQP